MNVNQCAIRFPSCRRGVAVIIMGLMLSSCSDGSDGDPRVATAPAVATPTVPPTASVDQTDAVLGKTEPIVVRFSKSVDPVTLQLAGALAAEADLQWSRSSSDNDTLTLLPHGGSWISGDGQHLTVSASDAEGNRSNTLQLTYLVKLVFDNFDLADVVIGQPDFASNMSDQGGTPGANTLGSVYGPPLVTSSGMLFIGDYFNNRVLGFNTVPTTNDAPADFVLGQPDFTSTAYAVSQSSHPGAQNAVEYGGRIAVVNYRASRIVIYDSVPADGTAVPSTVLGQSDFTSSADACSPSGLYDPETVAATPDGKLIVTDSDNNRVLIWNQWPAPGTSPPPDLVLGQADLSHCTYNDDNQDGSSDATPSARTLQYPAGVWSDGARLVLADNGNNRVLIWNTFPSTDFQPADIVLGQSDFAHAAANDDDQDDNTDMQPTARTLNDPYDGVASNGVQLAVADTGNHRILLWNSFPTANFQAADTVVGQGSFQNSTGNDDNQDGTTDSTTARVLSEPTGVSFYRDKLLVVDRGNHRVLLFKSK